MALLIIKFSVAQWKSNIQMIEARILIGTQGRLLVFILISRWLTPRDILRPMIGCYDYFDIGITPLDWKAFYFPFFSNLPLRWPLYNI